MQNKFCGRYFKCQSDTQTLAVIAADAGGKSFVQMIGDGGAVGFSEKLDGCVFASDGIILRLDGAVGELKFGCLTPLEYDIMGPFKYVPFLQCRHSVVSMRHRVDGTVTVNGVKYEFLNALGYIEGDRGRSFPSEYAWTHSFFDGGSLMLSAAEIPFGAFRFTGVIGAVLLHGRQYRIASYLGAKAVRIQNGEIVVRQGRYTLVSRLIEKNAHPLAAPVNGSMLRTIHESAACRAFYGFYKDGAPLLELETDRASFEYEYGG